MKVLIVGNGGREHALAWAIARSPRVTRLAATRPNAGMTSQCQPVDLDPEDVAGIAAWVRAHDFDLCVVGPEAPLAAGLADTLRAEGRLVVGPEQAAARLEASKVFSKRFLLAHGIPTAQARIWEDAAQARAELAQVRFPLVLKADGLAAGKGVAIVPGPAEAEAWIAEVMEGARFGRAGAAVVAEEFLRGEEVSVILLTDGERALWLPSSQDHKARDEGDRGPNTGGMGAYSPAPLMTDALRARIDAEIVAPTLAGLRAEGLPFRGFLYVGVMVVDGRPLVLEYNVRLGDPETQPLLMRLASDLLPWLEGCAAGRLPEGEPRWDPRPAVCVVVASGGYPDAYRKGLPIQGLDAPFDQGVVFHAGTRRQGDEIVTHGGRVLGVTALGDDLPDAIRRAYARVAGISFEGAFHRRDIGQKALARLGRA